MLRKKFEAFDYFNYFLMVLISLITLYPFWYVLVISVSTQEAYYGDIYHLIPRSFSLDTYIYALTNPAIFHSFRISLVVTTAGTLMAMVLTSMGAYALSKEYLKGRKLFFRLIIFTMFFNGGLVPFYIVVSQVLRMRDTIFAFFVPMAINTYNLILMKNYFTTVPDSLEESAKIDGYNDILILFKIVIPVSKPIVATIALFYAVFFWNDFFMAMLFSSNDKIYPLSVVLRNFVLSTTNFMAQGLQRQVPDMIRAAVIIISIVPIMLVYPFIQKYFVQGIMLGSVKE